MSRISPILKSPFIALSDLNCRAAMYDEYNALVKNSTWMLVPKPPNANVVQSMWLFRYKYHADRSLSRYKAWLFANGRTQQPVHQLDVKNAFLNGDLSEMVYMYQPLGFMDSCFSHHVYQLQRSLYGLKQAPRAWFQWFASYALRVVFSSSRCDSLHVSVSKKYAFELLKSAHMANCDPTRMPVDTESKLGYDGILFLTLLSITVLQVVCSTLHLLVQISLILDFGLQLYASIIGSLVAYTDADWAGFPTTRRSTSGYCVFLGDNLLSWPAKRQHTLSRSSAEVEYRGVANVVSETAWLRNLLRELHTPLLSVTLLYCDNVSAIYMTTNHVQHQQTKHIEINIHFVHDMVARGQVRVLHVLSRY
ncbi:ribonuclease H-like domain-containing protein [Tanacetum coccineum]